MEVVKTEIKEEKEQISDGVFHKKKKMTKIEVKNEVRIILFQINF